MAVAAALLLAVGLVWFEQRWPITPGATGDPLKGNTSAQAHRRVLILAGLTHKSALITRGAFHLKARRNGNEFQPVDDDALELSVTPIDSSGEPVEAWTITP